MRELEPNAPHRPDPVEPHILYSPDGVTWERIPLPAPPTMHAFAVDAGDRSLGDLASQLKGGDDA